MTDWIAVILASLVAAWVQGAIGFGFGLVIMAILGLLWPVQQAAVLNVLAALGVNLLLLWRLRKYVLIRPIWPILFGVIAGAPLGVCFLADGDAIWLQLVLAIVLIISGIQAFCPRLQRWKWHPVYAGIPAGLLSGTLAGAYGTGGPPLVAWVSSQDYSRFRYAGTVQLLLAVSGVVRLAEMVRRGLLTQDRLPLSAVAAGAALIGATLGLRMLHCLPDVLLRRIVAAVLFLIGLKFLFTAIS